MIKIPFSYLKISSVLILLFSVTGCSDNDQAPPEPKGYSINHTSTVPGFSGENAFQYVLEQVAFGPRNPNSMGHQQALRYFASELEEFSDTVILQNFNYTGYEGEKLDLTNIIAKFNPDSSRRILLCAHWDCRPRAEEDPDPANRDKPIPGANDGASGVAVLLELAKIISKDKPGFGIDIILFDGEDYGKQSDLENFCIGSKYFAATIPNSYKPEIAILLDLVGDKNATFYREPNSVGINKKLVDEIWQIAERIEAKTFINRSGPAVYDDHIPLGRAGIRAINIIDAELVGGNSDPARDYWHTQNDVPDNLSPETLGEVGQVLTNLIYSVSFY